MRITVRSIARCFAALTLSILTACASAPTAAGPDRTGGFRLEVFVERSGDSYARYLLAEDGQLHFGGGFDAVEGKYSWSGRMTDEEIERLRELLVAEDWFHRSPPGTGRPPPRYEIELDRRGTERRLKVRGLSQPVEAVVEVLATAARRRHEDLIRSLPQPSGQ